MSNTSVSLHPNTDAITFTTRAFADSATRPFFIVDISTPEDSIHIHFDESRRGEVALALIRLAGQVADGMPA